MKRSLIITINLLIMGFILFVIFRYASTKAEDSKKNEIIAFEKMTMTTNQIIANCLEDEQHLCDIWANYINRSAQAGEAMTADEAISFIRKAKTSPEIEGHLIFLDSKDRSGISTTAKVSDPDDYSVSYKNVKIFDNIEYESEIENENDKNDAVNLTRAYTNPISGVQSIAFYNPVNVLDEESGEQKSALLMRVVPLSRLEQKLVFLKGEYENVEISLIDKAGNYVVHGKSFKNSNFFEYYKSYNPASSEEYEQVTNEIAGGTGTMKIKNVKGEDCILSYTPLETMSTWFLLAYIPESDILGSRSIDWLLLGIASLGFLLLLIFNSLVMITYNRKLSEAALQANQANEAKSYFLSTMSHDIRTPMNAIMGLNEMVLRDSNDDNIRMYSESIRTAGSTLLGIINDILDFSKIEAGKMEIINVDYSFVSLLNDLVNMVQKKAEDKGLEFNPDIDRDIPSTLNGDEIRIKQIIINILSNAVKYTKQGCITFSVHADKIEDKPDHIKLKVSVRDTGIGIKPEDLDKLFVAFERIEEKKNRNIEGTGLGMTIVKKLTDIMGGTISIESEKGHGTKISVTIPMKWCNEDKPVVIDQKKVETIPLKGMKVLLVEDNEMNREIAEELLMEKGIIVDCAEDGDIAVEKIRKSAPGEYELVLMDVQMPRMNGYEATKQIRLLKDPKKSRIPIIAMTANAFEEDRKNAFDAGMNGHLAKPIEVQKLIQTLTEFKQN